MVTNDTFVKTNITKCIRWISMSNFSSVWCFRTQLKSESRSKQKGRVAARHLLAKSPEQTARRWTRTLRGTLQPTADRLDKAQLSLNIQTPAHQTGTSPPKERNENNVTYGVLYYTECFLMRSVSLTQTVCPDGNTPRARLAFTFQLWWICWILKGGGGVGESDIYLTST